MRSRPIHEVMSVYLSLKFIHIGAAIIAVGFNLSYSVWIARAAKQPEHWRYTLQTIRILDRRFANAGYTLLLISGLGMTYWGGIPLTTFWIAAALVLYVAAVSIGFFILAPLARQRLVALELHGADSLEFQQATRRARQFGSSAILLVLLILLLMIFKPTL